MVILLYEARFKEQMPDHLKKIIMELTDLAALQSTSQFLVQATDALSFEALIHGQIAG